MKLINLRIWVNNNLLTNAAVVKAIKDFGGIAAWEPNQMEVSKRFDRWMNLYAYWSDEPNISMRYVGECGTDRRELPLKIINEYWNTIYLDESSPYRLSKSKKQILHSVDLGYSSYRNTLFTIPTEKTDINIRLPFFPQTLTLKKLHNKYGIDHGFIWLGLTYNLFICRPYWRTDKKKWDFKPLFRIPFGWHVKSLIRFAEKYNKALFVYAGDDDMTAGQFIERLNLLKKYFN